MTAEAKTFRINVDRTKCASIGQCEFEAAGIFHINDDGILEFKEMPEISRRQAVEEAILRCPTGAISIVGEDI